LPKNTIHIIGGPTASGKSALALELAENHDGTIINADSMQIYDDLPILTAQPPKEDLEKTPHELYGVLHPNEACSAGNWREMVEPLIQKILNENKTPIVCGGSGLYIKALVEGLSPIPDIPDEVRNAVVKRYETIGAQEFYKDLEERDPDMAARFHVNHKARIIRAMEVLEATGQSLSEWQKLPPLNPPENWKFKIHKVMPERDILYQRCNDRLLWMIDNGALEEVEAFDKRIHSAEVEGNKPLCKALGFKPLRDYLRGNLSKDDAIAQAQQETRHYAKRQITWFKHQL